MDWPDLALWDLAVWDHINWASVYLVVEWAIRLVMLAVVPFRRSPHAASAWLLLILFIPWLGLVLYLAIGQPKVPAWRHDRISHFEEAMRPAVLRLQASSTLDEPVLTPRQQPVAALAERLGRFVPWAGNDVELLPEYEETLARLARDIDAAEDHVHLLYYIFAADKATAPIVEALGRAAQRGVTCRVLVDAFGSRRYLRRLRRRLRAAGVQLQEVLPYGFFQRRRVRFDLRNHRKIAVVDGRLAYTGSQNLVDPEFKRGIVYEELVARLEGPAVLQLQFIFAADWYLETGEVLDAPTLFPEPSAEGPCIAQVLPSGPVFDTQTTHRFVVALVHAARQRVVIVSPYFVPDEALLQALETAVLRGVEVHLVVPKKRDQFFVGLAQESYYGQLLDMGVQVHRYARRFLHAKHLSFDEALVMIGSSNMDIRSFELNDEVSLVVYGAGFAEQLREREEAYFAETELLTQEVWEARSRVRRLGQNIARLMSPLL